MEDYLHQCPPEILEHILRYLNGLALSNLKRSSKAMNRSLDNPTAWRIMFNYRFKSLIICVDFISGDINWTAEMNRLKKIKRNSRIISAANRAITPPDKIQSVKMYQNFLIINEYKPFDLSAKTLSWKKKNFQCVSKYPGYRFIGPFVGQIEAANKECHQIYDYTSNELRLVLKIYPTMKSTLLSFNKSLVLLVHTQQNSLSIWKISAACKDTKEVLRKKSTKKEEFCNECAHITTIEYDPEKEPHYPNSSWCSQIDEKLVLIPSDNGLRVISPIEKTNFDIQYDDTCQMDLEECLEPEQCDDVPRIYDEHMVDIDGEQHHIVHCIVKPEVSVTQHRFYNVTAKTVLASVNCWATHAWIPNTSYLALAKGNQVTVIDIKAGKIISSFYPKDERDTRGEKKTVKTLLASRSSPVLFVGLSDPRSYYGQATVLLFSAMTGALITRVCDIRSSGKRCDMLLTEDEQTLAIVRDNHVALYDLRMALACMHRHH